MASWTSVRSRALAGPLASTTICLALVLLVASRRAGSARSAAHARVRLAVMLDRHGGRAPPEASTLSCPYEAPSAGISPGGSYATPTAQLRKQRECAPGIPAGFPLPRCRCGAGKGRTIAWSAHDDEFSCRDRSPTAKHTAEGRRARCRAQR